ncbi:hypothetical protein IGI04_037306, partial [Brassica rapa subsp. trilocularis]
MEERMKRKKGTSVRGDQGVTVYGGCNKKKTDTKLIGHVNQMRSIIPKASVAKTEKLSRKDVTHRDESVTHESINGSLIYLTTRRSDLGLTTGIYTPWLAISRVSHQLVVKEISNHVKGILKLKLHYSFDTNMMMAETCDVNWMCYWDENNLKMCHKASLKVESVSSWIEELVTATRLRNSYRYIHIPLNGGQQISVVFLHDHATHVNPGKYPLCEPVSFIRICNQVESGYVVTSRGRI